MVVLPRPLVKPNFNIVKYLYTMDWELRDIG